jgi:hypothetical protein
MAEVVIFQDANFQGVSHAIPVGEFGVGLKTWHLDDAVSSIRVPPGMVAVVYEFADLAGGYGRFVDFLEDQPDMSVFGLNDQISWVAAFAANSAQKGQWVRNAVSAHGFVAGHWSGSQDPIASNPTPVVAPYAPPPALVHARTVTGDPWQNPPFDTSDPNWSSNLVGGKTLDGDYDHPFEWVSVLAGPPHVITKSVGPLNLKYVDGVQQDDQVAAAGVVVGPHPSGHDIPFTHPFGLDFEFGVVPDPEYLGLLAPVNKAYEDVGTYADQWHGAHRVGFTAPAGILPMEIEGNLVPDPYKAVQGDRVVLYGRWIVDAGHEDFHSEIHPPMLMARAHCIDATGATCPPRADATTWVQIWSRPYQGSQLFASPKLPQLLPDGVAPSPEVGTPLLPYLTSAIETLGEFDTYPELFPKPFTGIHLISLQIDPPTPRATGHIGPAVAIKHLECSYHLTTNGSCTVQIIPSTKNPDSVLVGLAFNSQNYPTLPDPPSTMQEYSVSELLAEGGQSEADLAWYEAWWEHWVQNTVHNREYGPVIPPNHESPNTTVPFTAISELPQSQVVTDTTQPFPVYGWVQLRWASPVSNPNQPPAHPVNPG